VVVCAVVCGGGCCVDVVLHFRVCVLWLGDICAVFLRMLLEPYSRVWVCGVGPLAVSVLSAMWVWRTHVHVFVSGKSFLLSCVYCEDGRVFSCGLDRRLSSPCAG